MAITINTLTKPWIWVEATTGGSLSAATYYFIGYNAFCIINGAYYGYAPGPSSDQVSVTTDATNNRIKMEVYEQGGYISAYADTGDATHVTVTTTTAHGKSNGDTVYIRGSANYTGKYTVSSVTANTFDIVATWVSDDGSSNWYAVPGLPTKPTNYPNSDIHFYFKWDYYSMLRGDGTKFQWLNTNDSTYSNEWYTSSSTYNTNGHRRWGGVYYYTGIAEGNFTTAADSSKYRYYDAVVQHSGSPSPSWLSTNLFEGTSGGAVNGLMAHPEIALRKYDNAAGTNPAFKLPDGMSETESAICIFIDNTDSNNSWGNLMTALYNSGMVGKSAIVNTDYHNSPNAYQQNGLMFRGILVGQAVDFTTQPIWYGKTITMIHGNIYFRTSGTKYFTFNGCQLYCTQIASSYWYQPYYSATNTRNDTMSGAWVIDGLGTMSNFTPFGYYVAPSSYVSRSGYNFIGKGQSNQNYIQLIRYPVDGATVTNCNLYKCAAYQYFSGAGPRTYTWTNVAFYQIQSDATTNASAYNMDYYHEDGFTGGTTVITHTMNCYNVTSGERSNKLCRVKFTHLTTPGFSTSSVIVYNFFFPVDIKVTDEAGNAIEGATVTIVNSASSPITYTATTAASGSITQQNVKCYAVEFDNNNTDGYWYGSSSYKFYSKTTTMNDLTLTISKSGYETYTGKLDNVLEAQDMTITLKTAKAIIIDTDGDAYFNLDKVNLKTGKGTLKKI